MAIPNGFKFHNRSVRWTPLGMGAW